MANFETTTLVTLMSAKSQVTPLDAVPATWVEHAPRGLRPWLQLMRLDRPIGTWLLFWPCVFGLLLGAAADERRFLEWRDLYLLVLFGIGSLVMRGAGCTFNDIVDRKIDAQVARTRGRPLPSGAISLRQAVLLLIVQAACGYSLAGRGSFLPVYIKTIGVPQFTNLTSIPDVDRRVTERVRTELIGRGKWTVKPDAVGVDGLITGNIVSIGLVPAAFNAQQQATRYAIILTARVEFKDMKADKVLWSNPSMQYREEFDVTTATATLDATAFFGQDVNALDRLSSEFARAVVSAILEAF